MTDQARKRAEEWYEVNKEMGDSGSKDTIIAAYRSGHASALEEIGNGINDHDGETYAEEYCIEMGHSETDGHEEFEAVKQGYKIGRIVGNLRIKTLEDEIATLRAQLEKLTQQRDAEVCLSSETVEIASAKVAGYDAELAQAKGV